MKKQLKATPKEAVVKHINKLTIVQPQVAVKLNLPILFMGTINDCKKYIASN